MTDQDPKPADRVSNQRPLSVAGLFGSRKEIELEYRGEIYRLRITRNNKLILTK